MSGTGGAAAALARAVRADPAVFVPFARAYALIVRRRSRMRAGRGLPSRGRFGLSPFHMICVTATLFGLIPLSEILKPGGPLPGALASVSLGVLFVIILVLFDYLDLLANAEEYRVIGAHPHDAWSVLAAKLFVVGRAVTTVAGCYYAASVIAVGFAARTPVASAAFALGAFGATMASMLGAALLGIGILERAGRTALLRLLPWIQGAFLAGYLGLAWGRSWLRSAAGGAPFGGALPPGAWGFLPPAWFLSPLEWAIHRGSDGTWVRGALAVALLGGLTAAGSGRLRHGFGEAVAAARGAPGGAGARSRGARSRAEAPRWPRDPAARSLWMMARTHARTDLAFRSQLVTSLFAPAMMIAGSFFSGGSLLAGKPIYLLLLVAGAAGLAIAGVGSALTTSTSRSALWIVLVSPVDRVRYALATRGILRVLAAPFLIGAGAWYLAVATEPVWERFLRLAAMGAYLEAMITVQRGLVNDVPFSTAPSRHRKLGWRQAVGILMVMSVAGGGALGLALFWLFGFGGVLASAVILIAVRLALEPWTRWRVAGASRALES